MAKPAVILVGADKGGVGKTTVSRTLLDYFTAHQIPIRAFDTEAPKGTLKRFHPDLTDVVDMTKVPDQMKIFDTLNSAEATVTLIDVRAGLMSPTLQALRDIGFIEAAKKGQITFALFHILGPDHRLARRDRRHRRLSRRRALLPGQELHQQHRTSSSGTRRPTRPTSTASRTRSRSRSRSSTRWRPSRSTSPRCRISPSSPTRSRAASPPSYSFVLRGYVRHWLGNVWAEYDRIKLTDIVAARAADARGTAAGGRPQAAQLVRVERQDVSAIGSSWQADVELSHVRASAALVRRG